VRAKVILPSRHGHPLRLRQGTIDGRHAADEGAATPAAVTADEAHCPRPEARRREILSLMSNALRRRGGGQAAELRAVEIGIRLEHAIDGVQEFTHDGDQCLEGFLAGGQELFIESTDMGFVLRGH
jgi:hypothetical protein